SPLYLESTAVLALAGFTARAAAAILSVVGVSAHAAANVLWTPRGGFLVTQECISTPLIPVYFAAVCTYATTWWRPMLGVVAGAPLADPQGAIALLPAFQIGLYLALWVAAFLAAGWGRFFAGLAVLALTQMTGLLILNALASHAGLTAHVRDIRGWAVAGPLL